MKRRPHRVLRVRGGRVAWTNTSRISDDDVRDAIRRVARDVNLNRVVVHFKRHGRARRWGMAYNGIPSLANLDGLRSHEWSYLIVVSDDGDWKHTLAHEAKHIEQYREGTRRSEVACNAFADWLVARWAA